MAGTASFFQTWPDEGRRLRHLRGPASPLPRSARARPRPPEAPGHPRGLLGPPFRGRKPTPRPTVRALGRAGANRKTRPRETPSRLSLLPRRPGAREARPGPQRAQPRLAARLLRRPGPRSAAHPGRLQTWLPALHNPLVPPSPSATHTRAAPGRTQVGEELKVCFPPPHRLPRTAAGARGRQRVNPRALAPPSAPACPPSRSEPASCALPRAGAGEPAPGAPQVATITCKSSEREDARRGALLTAAGVRFLSSRWILLFMSMFPSSPLFKLNFPRQGRRGERRPGLRCEGRRKGSTGGRGRRRGPGRRAAGGQASGAPGAKLLTGAERNHGGKRGLEPNAGLTTAAPGRGPALRLNRRRGAGGCSAPHGPERRRSTRWLRMNQGRGGETRREGQRLEGKALPGGPERLPPLPPVARGVADVRSSSGASPPAAVLRPPPPGPHLAAPRRGSMARARTFAWRARVEALQSCFGGP